jgi:hypothetical protein
MRDVQQTGPHLIIDLGEEQRRRVEKLTDTGEGKLARKIQALVERSLEEDGDAPPEGVEVVPVVLLYRIKKKKKRSLWDVVRGW